MKKYIQYIHRPNNTELGKGNTHETYMLISTDVDLTELFPVGIDVPIPYRSTSNVYHLRSSSGSEFRVNQLGQLYRDYDVCEGDEIWITKIEDGSASMMYLEVKKFNKVTLSVSSAGTILGDTDRLSALGSKESGYSLSISDKTSSGNLSIVFDKTKKKRSDSPDLTDFYKVTFNGSALKNGNYLLDLNSHFLQPYRKCSYNEVMIDDALTTAVVPTPSHAIPDNYFKYFSALRTKPFLLLAGISGTGKSRIVRELAFRSCPTKLQDTDGTTPGNYLMVEVKPNWHDSTELLGYYSSISASYRFTKFIDFLVLAHNNLDTPFFVCLDEMNLAPVEQYFAEFLSVLETRRYPKGDNKHIKTGSLVDKKFMDSYPGWEKGQDLTLPDNVFIIGTVNMDDTTHQFSRKVIDRAMTIEMNGGDLDKMFDSADNLKYTGEWSLADFKSVYVQADEVLTKYAANSIKTDAPSRLEAINACLKGTPFEVSYRVLNELCIYIAVLLDSGIDYDVALSKAVDQITLMKILPRIEGDEDMFRIGKEDKNRLQKLQELFSSDTDTFKKLGEMIARLDNGFTRFWP